MQINDSKIRLSKYEAEVISDLADSCIRHNGTFDAVDFWNKISGTVEAKTTVISALCDHINSLETEIERRRIADGHTFKKVSDDLTRGQAFGSQLSPKEEWVGIVRGATGFKKINHEGIRSEFEQFLSTLGELKITPEEYDRISGAVYDLVIHCVTAERTGAE